MGKKYIETKNKLVVNLASQLIKASGIGDVNGIKETLKTSEEKGCLKELLLAEYGPKHISNILRIAAGFPSPQIIVELLLKAAQKANVSEKLLLARNCGIYHKNYNILHFDGWVGGINVLKTIVKNIGSDKILKKLLAQNGFHEAEFYETPLNKMAWSGKREETTELFNLVKSKGWLRELGYSDLDYYCATGNSQKVEEILEDAAKKGQLSEVLLSKNKGTGYTPLHWSAVSDSADVAKVIFKKAENNDVSKESLINAKGFCGRNSLHIAASFDSPNFAREILVTTEKLKNLKVKDLLLSTSNKRDYNYSLLHMAACNNSHKVTLVILENGSKLKGTILEKLLFAKCSGPFEGYTPLHVNAEYSKGKILVANGLLRYARKLGPKKLEKLLAEKSVSDYYYSKKVTALDIAKEKNNKKLIEELDDWKKKVSSKSHKIIQSKEEGIKNPKLLFSPSITSYNNNKSKEEDRNLNQTELKIKKLKEEKQELESLSKSYKKGLESKSNNKIKSEVAVFVYIFKRLKNIREEIKSLDKQENQILKKNLILK